MTATSVQVIDLARETDEEDAASSSSAPAATAAASPSPTSRDKDPVVCAVDFGVENFAYWIGRYDEARRDYEFLAWNRLELPNRKKQRGVTRHDSERGMVDVLFREPAFERVTHFDLEQQDPVQKQAVLRKRGAPPGANEKSLAANVTMYGACRSLAGALYAHFRPRPEHLQPRLSFSHPNAKFRGFGVKCPASKDARKKASGDLIEGYVNKRVLLASAGGRWRAWQARMIQCSQQQQQVVAAASATTESEAADFSGKKRKRDGKSAAASESTQRRKQKKPKPKRDDLADAAWHGMNRLRQLSRKKRSAAAYARELGCVAALVGENRARNVVPPPPPPKKARLGEILKQQPEDHEKGGGAGDSSDEEEEEEYRESAEDDADDDEDDESY